MWLHKGYSHYLVSAGIIRPGDQGHNNFNNPNFYCLSPLPSLIQSTPALPIARRWVLLSFHPGLLVAAEIQLKLSFAKGHLLEGSWVEGRVLQLNYEGLWYYWAFQTLGSLRVTCYLGSHFCCPLALGFRLSRWPGLLRIGEAPGP